MILHEVYSPMEHDIHRDIQGQYNVPWVDQSLYSPMEHDIHRDIQGQYNVPWVDQSLYSPKLKVIKCFII